MTVENPDNIEIVESEIQLAVFDIADEKYAIDIMKIKEIIKPSKATPLPDMPDFIKGVINLRGMLLPLISLRERLGLSCRELTEEDRVIIAAMNKLVVGILVDKVEEIVSVPVKDVQLPPKIAKGIESKYLLGLCNIDDDVILLLDMEKILTTVKKVMMEKIKDKEIPLKQD